MRGEGERWIGTAVVFANMFFVNKRRKRERDIPS